MLRYALLLALVVGAVASAAPVPKSIKRKKAASPDGTWKLVEFWSNGNKGTAQGMTPIWVLEGEAFYVGPKQEGSYWQLTIPDPDKPTLRRFAPGRNTATTPYQAAVEVDGDTLKFCYASDTSVAVTECSPNKNVHYYVFTRVTDGGAAADTASAVDDLPRKQRTDR